MKYISLTEKYFKKMNASEQLNFATKAAWLSYVGGYTQTEVAKRLNVSSAKAHRLIAFAHTNNIVKIFIEGEIIECVELEEQLLKEFKLNSCHVAPKIDNDLENFNSVGTVAASFLYRIFKSEQHSVIGIGKGRTLSAAVENLPRIKSKNLQFVSVSGGLTRKFSTNPYDVLHRISERTGAEAYFLPVPYMAKDKQEKKMLLAQQSVIQMLDFAKTAKIFIVGLGSIEGNAHVHQNGLIEETIWQTMVANDAVGDFMGSFLDKNGNQITHLDNQLSLGLSTKDIKGKQVIAIVGGLHKACATLAALKTETITDLIISEQTAKQLSKLIR